MTPGLSSEERSAYWERAYLEATVNALKAIREGAKQLITLTSALQGLYFLAISVSTLKSAVQDWRVLVFLLPIVVWLVCLGLAVSVFVPESQYITRQPDKIEQAFRDAARHKLLRLQWAQWLLVASMGLLLAEVILYFVWIPAPLQSP